MDELEQLEKENARLDAEEEVREDMKAYQKKKERLKKRIWAKKHRRVVKVIRIGKRVGGIAKQSTQGVGIIFGRIGKSVAPTIRQGAINFTSNLQNSKSKRQIPTRRVVKIKKTKRRKKKRVVRRKVRRKQDRGISPFQFPFG